MIMTTFLRRLGFETRRWAISSPWTDVYGLARTILALSTAATLAFTDAGAFFRPAAGLESVPVCAGPAQISFFCLFEPASLHLAQWFAIVALLVVASGWRPQITGIVHWWISYSFVTSIPLVDGGDQIAAILALLFLPVTLTDSRRWHWETAHSPHAPSYVKRIIARSCFLVVRIQVAVIYFHAAVGKFSVEEWADGTAMYYWLLDPLFGVSAWIEPVLVAVLMNPVLVTLMTWGAILFEILLFGALFMPPQHRRYLLVPGLLFHFAIAVLIGIPSFSLVMFAALSLYLLPVDQSIGINLKAQALARRVRALRGVRIRASRERAARA
jgi:antimicrobial peptide system SdpB family protein